MESIKKFYSSEMAHELNGENSTYYVGRTEDIKNLWETVVNKNKDAKPLFCTPPVFSEEKHYYCMEVDNDGYATIINSDTFLMLLLEGWVEQAEQTTESIEREEW